MKNHQHATNRVWTVVIAECPNVGDCDVSYTVESEGKMDTVDALVERVTDKFETCPECGLSMATIRKSKQVEVLE